MNSITKLAGLTRLAAARRAIHISVPRADAKQATALQDFNPTNYEVPLRIPTMDDGMEPFGSWKVAYEAERKRANKKLYMGIASFALTMVIVINSGILDGIWMPNLDNIMEETGRVDEGWEREGRRSVIQPEVEEE